MLAYSYKFGCFKPHQRGGGCCSSLLLTTFTLGGFLAWFQTPSAGRWVLQRSLCGNTNRCQDLGFKPHQRGGGCCSYAPFIVRDVWAGLFQTPSAGRWVLQPEDATSEIGNLPVSNPISGEVGAAAAGRKVIGFGKGTAEGFQTPSAGRWVLQPIICEVNNLLTEFQTPSAGRWVLQRDVVGRPHHCRLRFKPHQRGGGCCSNWQSTPPRRTLRRFKPHQRGGGCCSDDVLLYPGNQFT